MASIIRIKRSTTAGDPSKLGTGELAYSAADYGLVDGGGKLYIGIGTEDGGGNAPSHIVIGGAYFTDKLDHTPGTLTASSALIVDSNSKLDNLKVDNIDINGNTISSTNTDGNIILAPNGNGSLQIESDVVRIGDQNVNATLTTYGTGDLILNTNGGTSSGSITIADGADGNITISTNGTGDIYLDSDTVRVGDAGATATITSNGAGDLVLNTNAGANSGSITINEGVDGNIDIATNGNGDITLGADTIRVGDQNANATITTYGTGDLTLSTNEGTNSGSIVIRDGVDADITIATNGTGDLHIVTDTVRIGDQNANATITTHGTGDLILSTNEGIDSGTITIEDGEDGNIVVTPNGDGDFQVLADTIRLGDQNANTTVTTWGTGDLVLNTNGGTNSGSITIADGTDGNITIATNGTGDVLMTADTLRIGDQNANATITTHGTGDLILSTNEGTNSGTITIEDGSNGNIILDPNGNGLVSINNAYTLPGVDGSSGYVLTTNGSGVVSWQQSSSQLTIGDDAAETETISLLTDTLSILGGTGLSTTVGTNSITVNADLATTTTVGVASFASTDFAVSESGEVTLNSEAVSDIIGGILVEGEGIDILYNDDSSGTIVISAELATTANRGVASFSSASFTVSNGAVSIKNAGISNLQLANSSVTIGNTTVSLGGTATTIGGLTELTIDNININGNTISSTDTNGNVVISPNGTGYIDVDTSYIKNLKDPVDPQDAATKYYVDQIVSGLNWKSAVNLLANVNVALTGATETLIIDGHSALDQTDDGKYRILLTNQSTDSQNGIYIYTDDGEDYTLVRAADADVYTELIGSSVFVMEGDTYANTGWVQNNHYLTDFTGQEWVQFSGAGAYTAGDGLGQNGTEFFVKVPAENAGGLVITSDQVQIASTLAGDGLTYAAGILAVGGTSDRISVTSNAIDIASTYSGQSSIITVGTLTSGALGTGFTTVNVAQGGTGVTTFTSNGIIYGNGSNALQVTAAGTWDSVTGTGQLLSVNSSGVPTWTNVIDGGTY